MGTFIFKVLKSFTYATQGIISVVRERNMKVHIFAMCGVLVSSVLLPLSSMEWIIVLMLIAGVIGLEMVNTAIEALANIVRDELKLSYQATQRTRDIAAGVVLVYAIMSAIVAGIIFLPKFFVLFFY